MQAEGKLMEKEAGDRTGRVEATRSKEEFTRERKITDELRVRVAGGSMRCRSQNKESSERTLTPTRLPFV